MKITFVIRCLGVGGAERQLCILAKGLARRGHTVVVVTLYPGGAFEPELLAAGIQLQNLGKGSRWNLLAPVIRLRRHLLATRPDVVHGYLDVPNVLSTLASAGLRGTKVVWGIRGSGMDLDLYDHGVRLARWVEGRLSPLCDGAISNSRAGAKDAISRGFPASRVHVVPNGIDLERFHFDPVGRARLREAWGIQLEEVLVGMPGRMDAAKDQATFLKAAACLAPLAPHVRWLCIGPPGDPSYVEGLSRIAAEYGIAGLGRLVGPGEDIVSVYSALDLAVSSSRSEGFSNTLAEAMACGRTCVATDVGDSAWLVGDTGRIVPPERPDLMAEAILMAVGEDRTGAGALARGRIERHFSIDRLLEATEAALAIHLG